jgi:NAD(P)-dependent dehydrogenase (short-subunit alcohol dehydrogenase family)
MSRIFLSGSSDGLGLMAAKLPVEQGHSVVLHARNAPHRSPGVCHGRPVARRAL